MMLKSLWLAWKALARRIGEFQSRVILTLLYFVLVLPFAIGVKILADPLKLANKGISNWLLKPIKGHGIEEARRQF